MVVVGLEEFLPHVQDLLVLAGEGHAGVAVDRHFAGDRRTGDGGEGDLLAQFLGELVGQHVRQDLQVALVVGAQALGQRHHVHAGAQQPGELLTGPLDAEGVDTAHHEVDALEGLVGVLELVGLGALGHLELQIGVDAGLLDRVDDLAVQVGADQTDRVPVVGEGGGQGRGHDAGAEHDECRHQISFRRGPSRGRLPRGRAAAPGGSVRNPR